MLPIEAEERKATPIFSGVLRYFPDALAYVAHVSKVGNDQHNPGQPLHWAKEKSTDEGDALVRHQIEAGGFDTDGLRHSGKVAWRALAQLQRELEAANERVDEPSTAVGPWSDADERILESRLARAFHPRGAHPGTPCNSCRPLQPGDI